MYQQLFGAPRIQVVHTERNPETQKYVRTGTLTQSCAEREENIGLIILNALMTDSHAFNGELSFDEMQNGMNELEFIVPEDAKYYGLSGALDWVSIHPQ